MRLPLIPFVLLAACAPEPMPEITNDTAAMPQDALPPTAPVAPAPPSTAAQPQSDLALTVDGEGLRLVARPGGSTRPIPFGTPRDRTLAALAFRGPPGTGTNQDCGVDYAAWPDGLTLHFQDGDFAGWALDGRGDGAITTMSGVTTGSTRADLEDAYSAQVSETTIGTEFTAGDLAGLLDGPGQNARITNLWGGMSCVMR